jgi:hypothetical protein
VARVCERRKIGVDLDSRIHRDLRRIERPAEGKVNWRAVSDPDRYILRPMRCHRLLSKLLCTRRGADTKADSSHSEAVKTKEELTAPKDDLAGILRSTTSTHQRSCGAWTVEQC